MIKLCFSDHTTFHLNYPSPTPSTAAPECDANWSKECQLQKYCLFWSEEANYSIYIYQESQELKHTERFFFMKILVFGKTPSKEWYTKESISFCGRTTKKEGNKTPDLFADRGWTLVDASLVMFVFLRAPF